MPGQVEEGIRLARFTRFPPDRGDRPRRDLTARAPGAAAAEQAAEQTAEHIEAIRAQHEDRLARLTLTRIELVDRAERAALADLDRRAATEGADLAQIEGARTAVVAAAEEERRQLRIEGAREAARIGEEALADEDRAQADAAQRLADARAQIEAREIDLGLVSQYEAAIREAGRWRAETLADLDAVGGGSEALRARVEAVYRSMTDEARAASQAQREANDDWIGGVRSGLEQIREDSDTAFDAARDATIDTFRSMEDAIASAVTSGKLDFSSFVDSVIADLARLAARQAITIPLANALFSACSPARAAPSGAPTPSAACRPAWAMPAAPSARRAASRAACRRRSSPAPRAITLAVSPASGRTAASRGSGRTRCRSSRRPARLFCRAPLARPCRSGAPSIQITFENRGTPQREVSREVRLDPRGLIVTVVTEDLDGGGPASQAIARRFGLRDAVA